MAQFEHMDLLLDELSRINPSELLVSDEQTDCFPEPTPRFITTDILFCLPRPFPIC
ncbi:hypothetical protein M5E88_03340 [Akkermansia muciniphila]|nr:hypothetical protein M5E88_03340 [Akkermansia muciniphila]